jgi:C-terminal processing protease CtpA/Prc
LNTSIREDHAMPNRKLISSSAALLLLALAASGAAQQPAPDQNQRAEAQRRAAQLEAERERTEQERERAEQQRERLREQRDQEREQHADLERSLSEARRELEEAAREVARLSGQLAAPFVDGIARNFRFAGQRAMLGIGIEDTERGVRVASVTPNGPAADAGLKVGDTITAIDGAELADPRVTGRGRQSPSEILVAQMANVDAGEPVELRVLGENGTERDATVAVRDFSPWVFSDRGPNVPPKPPGDAYSYRYDYGRPSWFARSSPWAEMQLVTLTPELGAYFGTSEGLLVVRGPESDALGLRDGDVILDIGGRKPTTPEHAIRILGSFQPGEPLRIAVMRDRRRQTIDVQMPSERDER